MRTIAVIFFRILLWCFKKTLLKAINLAAYFGWVLRLFDLDVRRLFDLEMLCFLVAVCVAATILPHLLLKEPHDPHSPAVQAELNEKYGHGDEHAYLINKSLHGAYCYYAIRYPYQLAPGERSVWPALETRRGARRYGSRGYYIVHLDDDGYPTVTQGEGEFDQYHCVSEMNRSKRRELIELCGFTPDEPFEGFKPASALITDERSEDFLYQNTFVRKDGITMYSYEHSNTGRYLYLSEDGRAWRFRNNTWVGITPDSAIQWALTH